MEDRSIKISRNFKADFGILHDCDTPLNKNGVKNGAWTMNFRIYDELEKCRTSGMTVRHRISVPNFERRLGGQDLDSDKPFAAYSRLKHDEIQKQEIRDLLTELRNSNDHYPFTSTDIQQIDVYKKCLEDAITSLI
ncbi:MAG: hypothetical protein HQL96_03785 [Magnetococcales bacterium]|nr:hypothetical protein [Magnetococcales bacterium]